jgi:hypothetical protein
MADPQLLPSHFPDLPEQNPPWPDNIVQGHVAVKEVYENGVQLGRQDEASLSRLEVDLQRFLNLKVGLPILIALFQAAVGAEAWQTLCIDLFERAVGCLVQAISCVGTR